MDKETQSQELGSFLEVAAKFGALVGGISVFVGVIFNVTFFIGDRFTWIFFLSLTDNLTAALLAVPFVAFAFLVFPMHAITAVAMDPTVKLNPPVVPFMKVMLYVAFASVILGMWFLWPYFSTGAWASVFSVLIFVFGLAWAYGFGLRRHLTPQIAAFAVLALAIGLSFAGSVAAALFWRIAYQRGPAVDIETVDKNTYRSVIVGQVVRVLDGGIIVSRGDEWTWIPKTEMQRLSERER